MKLESTTHKQCSKCKEIKENNLFHKDKISRSRDGLRGECKSCASKYQRNLYNNNRDKILANQKVYREENHDKIIEMSRKYTVENYDKILDKAKKFREENRYELAAYQRRKRIENPEGERARSRKYREEKQSTTAILSIIGKG